MTTQTINNSATAASQTEPVTITRRYEGVVVDIKADPKGDIITVCLTKGTPRKPVKQPELFYSYELDPQALELHRLNALAGAQVWVNEGLDAEEALMFGPLHLTDAEAAFAAAENNEETNTMSTDNTATLVADEPKQLNGATDHPAEPETAAVAEQPAEAAPEAQAEDEQPKPTEFFNFKGRVTKTQSFRVFVEVDEPTRVDLDVRNPEIIFWRDRNSWGESFVAAYKQMKVWKGLEVAFEAARDAEDHLILRNLSPAGEFVPREGGEFVYSGPRQAQQRDNRRDQSRQGQPQQRDNRRDQSRQGQPQQRDAAPAKVERYAGSVYMVQQQSITVALNDRAQQALNKLRLSIPDAAYSAEFAQAMTDNAVVTGKTVVTFAWNGRQASDVKLAKTQPADKAAAK